MYSALFTLVSLVFLGCFCSEGAGIAAPGSLLRGRCQPVLRFEVRGVTIGDLPLTVSLCAQHVHQNHSYAEITVSLRDAGLG